MDETNHEIIRKKIHRRHLRLKFFLFFGKSVFWLLVAAVVVWGAGFFLVAPLAEAKLGKLCNGAVYVKSGQFKGFGVVQLRGVVVAENTDALADAPIFKFDEMLIAFDPRKLLRGKFEVSSILLNDFLLVADYDRSVRQWNFQKLARRGTAGQAARMVIPFAALQRGAVQIRRVAGDVIQPVTTIGVNGQIAVQAGRRQYNFALQTDTRFGFGDTQIQGVLTRGLPSEKSTLSIQGRLKMPQATVFENSWDLNNVQLECEFDGQEILLKHCGFSMGEGRVDVQGAIRRDAENRRTFDVSATLENLELSDRFEKNAIVYSEPVLEWLDSGLRRFLTSYHPAGAGDMTLSIQGHLDDLSSTVVNGAIVCRDITVQDEDFPYRLEHIQGTIAFAGRNLTLNQLKARHGEVELMIEGSIRNLGSNPEIDLRTTSSNLRFDTGLYEALSESKQKMWLSLAPQGTTAVDYHYQRSSKGGSDLTITLGLQKATLVYDYFPYPLENLTGTILIEPNRIEMTQLVTHYDDTRKVTLNGEITELGQPQPEFRIQVLGEKIPIDANLIKAMPPAQAEFLEKLQMEAVADVNVVVVPNVTGERFLDYTAKIQVDGKRLKFPLPMDDIHVTADVTPRKIQVHQFEGQYGDGMVKMSGTLTPQGRRAERAGFCLSVNLTAFDFNDVFWKAAEQDADRVLGKFRMVGTMDVRGRLVMNFPDETCPSTDLEIQCFDNPVLWDNQPLGQAEGKVLFKEQSILFEKFRLEDIQLETLPAGLLEGRLKTAYSAIQPQGKIGLEIDSGSVRITENGPRQIEVAGTLLCDNLSGGNEGVINELTGRVIGRLHIDRETKTGQVSGSYDMERFKYRRWLVSNVHGDLVYDPNTSRLQSRDFVADLYGGRAAGAIEVDLSNSEKTGYKLGLSLSNVNVPELLAVQIQDAPQKVMQGLVAGALNMEGNFQSPSERRGKVTARITDIKLGRQSLFGKILTAMQFKRPDEFVFSEIETKAFVRGDELILEDVRMVGKPLIFRGQGKLNLRQKQIEMDFVAFDRWVGREDTILDLLARGIGSAIWKVEIRGDIDNPQFKTVFLSVLKQPLDIFNKKTE